jgi:hypothetical protein
LGGTGYNETDEQNAKQSMCHIFSPGGHFRFVIITTSFLFTINEKRNDRYAV